MVPICAEILMNYWDFIITLFAGWFAYASDRMVREERGRDSPNEH